MARAAPDAQSAGVAPTPPSIVPPPIETPSRNATEQAIAGRLELILAGAEIMWLVAPAEEFLAVYRESEIQPPNGAIIINTANGLVVDNSRVHRVIAEGAASSGWTSLSIQPIANNAASTSVPEERAHLRLNSAVEYVRRQGIENIIVVGDAGGANTAIQFITKSSPAGVVAAVGLGMWDEDLTGTDIPVLDIVGTRDHQALIKHQTRAAKTRRRANRVDLITIDGADASFSGYEDIIAKRLRGWLERITPGVAVRRRYPNAAPGGP